MQEKNVVVMSKRDNVATVIRDLAEGETLIAETIMDVKTLQPIPFGHKVALRDIQAGEEVIKYGESIGAAFAFIKAGKHVHIHNTEGRRGRGDQQGR
ncbi:MAG: UxaA family hydrolase [Bacillota bacterium]